MAGYHIQSLATICRLSKVDACQTIVLFITHAQFVCGPTYDSLVINYEHLLYLTYSPPLTFVSFFFLAFSSFLLFYISSLSALFSLLSCIFVVVIVFLFFGNVLPPLNNILLLWLRSHVEWAKCSQNRWELLCCIKSKEEHGRWVSRVSRVSKVSEWKQMRYKKQILRYTFGWHLITILCNSIDSEQHLSRTRGPPRGQKRYESTTTECYLRTWSRRLRHKVICRKMIWE